MRYWPIVLLLLAWFALPENVCAQSPPGRDGERIDLQKQLETGLKARRPKEFAFIKRIVTLVEQQKLPRKLVEETFVWARKKRRYPYVYFERALRTRAARLGVDL